VHPESKKKMDIIFLTMQIRLFIQYSRQVNRVPLHMKVAYCKASNCKQLQALTRIKCEPLGGPKSGGTGPVGVPQYKKKRLVQPFSHSPVNTKGRLKTPLDGRRKWAKYGSIHEQVGGICTRDYSSNNENEESDSLNGSNEVEVKGDVDYTIRDLRQNMQIIFINVLK
jgi:hypothetical protein